MRHSRRAAYLALVIHLQCGCGVIGVACAQPDPLENGGSVAELVETFFESPDRDRRRGLIGRIEEAANGSIGAVVEALSTVQLWHARGEREGALTVSAGSTGVVRVAYHLPSAYDPARRYPVVFAMSSCAASEKGCTLPGREILRDVGEPLVLVCPTLPVDGSFHRDPPRERAFRRLLRAVRRAFHVDTDRMYLWGGGSDGDAGWLAAIAHPHEFAGAIFVGSYLDVPYPEQMYPLLLGNLRSLPVLATWVDPGASSERSRVGVVAAHDRAMLAFARQQGLPITGKAVDPSRERPEGAVAAFKASAGELGDCLARTRVPPSRTVTHRFRYPDQGDAGWLRLTKFKGDVWEEEQLSILPSPLTDRDAYITSVLEEKLAYIGATVEGQTITIETRKCGKLEILFPFGLIDFDKPVTIRVNGKRRHHGVIRPDIRTLLETTYETWDFQRLTPAQLSISIRSDRKER
ncbi:MAG: hypothetical protein PVI86_03515 [Phycisphaerae bacterium]|jgi:hypothetical protein